MSTPSHEDPHVKLNIILFFFTFSLVGVFSRQLGFTRCPYHVPLYIFGMIIGIYYVEHPESHIPILDQIGPIWFYNVYFPVYFFIGAFNLDYGRVLHLKIIPHIALECFPVWAINVFTIATVLNLFLEVPFESKKLAVMIIAVMVPDLQMTRMFLTSTLNFARQEVNAVLEFESLVGSIIGSTVYLMFLTGQYQRRDEFLAFSLKTIIACLFGLCMGKLTTSAVTNMLYDSANQIAIVFTAVMFTFASATLGETSGDVAVLVLGIVMMNSKPAMTAQTVDLINRFIDVFRFAVISSCIVIAGILLTFELSRTFIWEDLYITLTIYAIVFATRFLCTTGLWLVSRGYFLRSLHEAVTISACDMRGTFNIILILTLRPSEQKLPMENRRLFLLASLQIFLSFFVTTPIAAWAANVQRRHTFDVHKISMIRNAIRMINEYKESMVSALQRMAFTADADWDKVTEWTSIKNSFLRRYEYNKQLRDSLSKRRHVFDESKLRQAAIKDVLRLQKRFIEEQLRHGTLGSQSAKYLAFLIKKCLHKSSLMSAEQIIINMAPKKYLKIVHRDLVWALDIKKSHTFRSFVTVIFLNTDIYLLFFISISKIFLPNGIDKVVLGMSWYLTATIVAVSTVGIVYTGRSYLHTCASSLWNWLAWIIWLCSSGIVFFEIIFSEAEHNFNLHLRESRNLQWTAFCFFIVGTGLLTLVRATAIACLLEPVQTLLFRFVTNKLNRATFNQCDACQGFLQVTVDSLQRVRAIIDNHELAAATQARLHQESLVMRQFLGTMDILTPNVMAALKAKIASRLVLMSNMNTIHKLHHSGMLGVKEEVLLVHAVQTKMRSLYNFLPTLNKPYSTELINSIPWIIMANIKRIDVTNAGTMMTLKPGDVLIAQGSHPYGIFIILEGLVRVDSTVATHPTEHPLAGQSGTDDPDKGEELSDFYSRGNVIGEYIVLTGGESHKTFRCVTTVRLLAISNENLYKLMGGKIQWGGAMNRLEYSMWTTVADRLAVRLIQKCATYHLLTRRQIYMMMEEAYVIDGLREYSIDLRDIERAAVILLYGDVFCINNGRTYSGPCILPSHAEQLDTSPSAMRVSASHGPKRRVVLFVLRSYRAMRVGKGYTPLRGMQNVDYENTDSCEEDDITISSGASDAAPCRKHTRTHRESTEM